MQEKISENIRRNFNYVGG